MAVRHDAGFAACAVATFVRVMAKEMGAGQVATVGHMALYPNLINVIAARATLTVDLRNTDESLLQQSESALADFLRTLARNEGVTITSRRLARFAPVVFDTAVVQGIDAVAQCLGLRHRRMTSGAGHDAQMLARICPSAMIFVPSVKGISHNPAEHTEPADLVAEHLEKRYFETGNLEFNVFRAFGGILGMAICNDRRWPETYRVMGLQGVEMILIGHNTQVHNPLALQHDALSNFHNALVLQSGAYQNGSWVVGVAKAGNEEGVSQIGSSVMVAPSGEIVAACSTLGDELAIARCDLELTTSYKNTTFNFAKHRELQAYGLIVERNGAEPPPQ